MWNSNHRPYHCMWPWFIKIKHSLFLSIQKSEMAASLTEDDQNLVSCGNCLEVEGYILNPVLLPCSHSFCETCIRSHLKKSDVFKCKVCRWVLKFIPCSYHLFKYVQWYSKSQPHFTEIEYQQVMPMVPWKCTVHMMADIDRPSSHEIKTDLPSWKACLY